MISQLVTEELAEKYFQSLVKQMLQVRTNWTNSGYRIFPANIGYKGKKE